MYSPYRSSPPEVLLRKGVLKIWSKFTGELPNRSVVSIKMLCNSIEIALRHGCFPVNLLHIFRTSFYKNTYGGCFCIASHISLSWSSQENVWKKSATKGNSKGTGCMVANLLKTNFFACIVLQVLLTI